MEKTFSSLVHPLPPFHPFALLPLRPLLRTRQLAPPTGSPRAPPASRIAPSPRSVSPVVAAPSLNICPRLGRGELRGRVSGRLVGTDELRVGPQEWALEAGVLREDFQKPLLARAEAERRVCRCHRLERTRPLSHRELFTRRPAVRAWVKGPRGCFSPSTHCESRWVCPRSRVSPESSQNGAGPSLSLSSPTLITWFYFTISSSLILTELFCDKGLDKKPEASTLRRTCHFPRPTDLRHLRGD